ncbi:plasmid mobilization protein [Geomonas oryzae]|uniref:plasmid mobilization protein n=1 Tax=Geomonas oryzae TaxID=2364273 RepID=UPI0013A5EC3D|nr:ribbon-helix-helix protein, CopG family [Geomonas oryzae]
MQSIHVRVSEEEEALLQEKAALLGKSVSELVRDVLFRDLDRILERQPATFGQVEELKAELIAARETIRELAVSCGRISLLEERFEALSELKTAQAGVEKRLENAEEEIHALSENLVRQAEIQTEERNAPFGMQRSFVQVALMAAYTLARGTFSNNTEAWNPYKDEARRRAFPGEGGAP